MGMDLIGSPQVLTGHESEVTVGDICLGMCSRVMTIFNEDIWDLTLMHTKLQILQIKLIPPKYDKYVNRW